MAEREGEVANLSELLVEITNHGGGSYACSVIGMKLEGEKAEAVTQFTSITDYF